MCMFTQKVLDLANSLKLVLTENKDLIGGIVKLFSMYGKKWVRNYQNENKRANEQVKAAMN